ncbi:hypothetical protein WJX72_012036 [[Myrmecia] bisecta]|uniref:Uncharacterized protein n=1 Tax=[Myrmecia] bisecta TaxID=41462 RepID=A0AAW1Q5V1_9CHLO
MAPAWRWVKPEVYPLCAAMGVALGMGAYMMYHQLMDNAEVTLNKRLRQRHLVDKTVSEEKDKAFHNAIWRRVAGTSIFQHGYDHLHHLHEDGSEAKH